MRSRTDGVSAPRRYVTPDYEIDPTGQPVVTYRFLGQPIARWSTAGLRYLLPDHLGSARVEADSSGTATGKRSYLPFGGDRAISSAADLATDARYTSQRRADAGNGNPRRELYHYGARAYLPGVGVFTQPDSIVPDYGDPRSLNRYAYTRGNPVKYTDPTGHRVSWGEEDGGDDSAGPGPVMDAPSEPAGADTATPNSDGVDWLRDNADPLIQFVNDANIVQGAVASATSLLHSGRYWSSPRLGPVMGEMPLAIAAQSAALSRNLTYLGAAINEIQIGDKLVRGGINSQQALLETGANMALTAAGAGLIGLVVVSSLPAWAIIGGAVAIGVGTNVAFSGAAAVIETGNPDAFFPAAGSQARALVPWPGR